MISAKGAVAPAAGFRGRSEDGRLDSLMKTSVLIRRVVVAAEGLGHGKRRPDADTGTRAEMANMRY